MSTLKAIAKSPEFPIMETSIKKAKRATLKKTDAAIDADVAKWRENRYGKVRVKLTHDYIARMAVDLTCGDTKASERLVLLMDEIERSDRVEVSSICITVRDAVMPYTSEFSAMC